MKTLKKILSVAAILTMFTTTSVFALTQQEVIQTTNKAISNLSESKRQVFYSVLFPNLIAEYYLFNQRGKVFGLKLEADLDLPRNNAKALGFIQGRKQGVKGFIEVNFGINQVAFTLIGKNGEKINVDLSSLAIMLPKFYKYVLDQGDKDLIDNVTLFLNTSSANMRAVTVDKEDFRNKLFEYIKSNVIDLKMANAEDINYLNNLKGDAKKEFLIKYISYLNLADNNYRPLLMQTKPTEVEEVAKMLVNGGSFLGGRDKKRFINPYDTFQQIGQFMQLLNYKDTKYTYDYKQVMFLISTNRFYEAIEIIKKDNQEVFGKDLRGERLLRGQIFYNNFLAFKKVRGSYAGFKEYVQFAQSFVFLAFKKAEELEKKELLKAFYN